MFPVRIGSEWVAKMVRASGPYTRLFETRQCNDNRAQQRSHRNASLVLPALRALHNHFPASFLSCRALPWPGCSSFRLLATRCRLLWAYWCQRHANAPRPWWRRSRPRLVLSPMQSWGRLHWPSAVEGALQVRFMTRPTAKDLFEEAFGWLGRYGSNRLGIITILLPSILAERGAHA